MVGQLASSPPNNALQQTAACAAAERERSTSREMM